MPNFVNVDEAGARLAKAKRVLVVGCSGGGKTTLALKIADRFGLEYQSIDRDVRWLPGSKVRDRVEQRAIVAELVALERWVMDGTNISTFELRVPRADLIVWVRVPRRIAMFGVFRRVAMNYRRVRVAMAKGCPEPIPDREFLSYIWSFERREAPRLEASLDKHGPHVPVVVLRSHREMRRLVLR